METTHETTLVMEIRILVISNVVNDVVVCCDLGNVLKIVYLTEFVYVFKRTILVIFNRFLFNHLDIGDISNTSMWVRIIHLTIWIDLFKIHSGFSLPHGLFTLLVKNICDTCLTKFFKITVVVHQLFFVVLLKEFFVLFQ